MGPGIARATVVALVTCSAACGGAVIADGAAYDGGKAADSHIPPLQDASPEAPRDARDSGTGVEDASIDGCSSTGSVTLASGLTLPFLLAVGASEVVWADQPEMDGGGEPAVLEVGKDGGTVETLASGGTTGLTLDSAHIYWSTGASSTTDGSIDRALLDGGEPTSLATGLAFNDNLLVYGEDLYWSTGATAPYSILRVSTGGGMVETLASLAEFLPSLVATNSTLYWTDEDGSIWSMSVDGGPVSSFYSVPEGKGISGATALATDGINMYWTQFTPGAILKLSLAEPGESPSVLSGGDFFTSIATDGKSVYYANFDEATGCTYLEKVPVGGGAATTIAADEDIECLTLDATRAYWTNREGGAVMATPK